MAFSTSNFTKQYNPKESWKWYEEDDPHPF